MFAGFPNSIDPYHLLTIALLCFSKKHSGFKEEAESRLIAYLWNRDPFENNGKSYLKYHFEASQVIRIVVGPSNNHQSNIIKIQDFIKKIILNMKACNYLKVASLLRVYE